MADAKDIWQDASSFRQRVRLAAVQVAALGADELRQALAYEVEPFSGIPAADAEVSWREVEDPDVTVKVYDVAERRRDAAAAKPGRGAERFVKPAAALAAIALIAACADAALLARSRRILEADVAERAALDAQIGSARAGAASARAEAAKLREGRAAAERAQRRVARMRAAYPDVMAAVASVCGGHVVVKSFESSAPFDIELTAVAISADAAAGAMAALARAVSGMGWRLVPGRIAASDGGDTALFSCRLSLEEEDGR